MTAPPPSLAQSLLQVHQTIHAESTVVDSMGRRPSPLGPPHPESTTMLIHISAWPWPPLFPFSSFLVLQQVSPIKIKFVVSVVCFPPLFIVLFCI